MADSLNMNFIEPNNYLISTPPKRVAIVVCLVIFAFSLPVLAADTKPRATTVKPVILELVGPLTEARAEVSGMTWKGDTLVVLPQNPTLFAGAGQLGFFVISRTQIVAAIDGTVAGPIVPRQVTCRAPGLENVVSGFDGLEAMGLMGERCYMTVEAKDDTAMAGYLVCGNYDVVNNEVIMDMTRLATIPMGLNIPNISEETIVIDGRRVITISEANGRNVNPRPVGKIFNAEIDFLGTIPLPNIEYRVTDATRVDTRKRFWVVNYYYPPERAKLEPAPDPELAKFGGSGPHDPAACIERLLELAIVHDSVRGEYIARTETPPVYLETLPDHECRNWEAVVRLGDRGFLLMTDKYPGTILAFVPYSRSSDH